MHVPAAHSNAQLLVSTLDEDTFQETTSTIFQRGISSPLLVDINVYTYNTCIDKHNKHKLQYGKCNFMGIHVYCT